MFTLIAFLIVLSVLVLAHEFGHFFAARKFGCKVDEFGFGFPPRAFGFRLKREGENGTLYSVNWIPLGGFVKIKGENGDEPSAVDSFASKKVWQRAIILSAGVGMNVLLAFVLLSVGYIFGVPQGIESLSASARVRDEKIQIMEVRSDSPAEKAGLKPGDALAGYLPMFIEYPSWEIKGEIVYGEIPKIYIAPMESLVPFEDISKIQEYFNQNTGNEVTVVFTRGNGERQTANVTPEKLPDVDRGGIGVALVKTGIVSYPWYYAPAKGAEATYTLTKQILIAFAQLIRGLIADQKLAFDVTGPVGIAVLTGEVARQGIVYFLYFISLLSVNLAIINFLPIPALDGGRFFFLMIEKIRSKPVSRKVENLFHTIGFVLLLALVFVVTVRDVRQFSDVFVNVWKKLSGG